MQKKKVLLDTDIGTDIDDAIALTYLLCQKDCELLGITTVSGESKKRATVADMILKFHNKKTAIVPGIEDPLIESQLQPECQQWERAIRYDHDDNISDASVLEFMKDIIEKNPNEVTLAVIGPATNAAVLFTVYPQLKCLVKEVVQMAGYYTGTQPFRRDKYWEWNIKCDPHAAQMLFSMKFERHRCFGLDVTLELLMTKTEMKDKFKQRALEPVNNISDAWFDFKKEDLICFHDPLAVLAIFNESICSYIKGRIEVVLSEKKLRGMTLFIPDEKGPHEIAVKVDKEQFYNNFFTVVGS